MPNLQNFDIYKGEDRTLTLYARNNSNNPQSLTGRTISWRVGIPPNDPSDDNAVITKTGTVISASAGTFSVSVTPSDTMYLDPGNYQHEAFTTASGGAIAVVTKGRFTLRPIIEAA